MKKLTNIHAAFAPPRDGGTVASVASFRAPAPAAVRKLPPRATSGSLHCIWTKDRDGHLVCAWSDASSTEDHSSTWRGMSRASAAMLMAA